MNIKIILIAVVLLIGAAAGGLYFTGFLDSYLGDAAPESEQNEPVEPEGPPVFLALKPFVLSYSSNGNLRYLQLTLELMTRSEEAVASIELQMPVIRNALIMLVSARDYDALHTTQGKEDIRSSVQDEINTIVGEKAVESVLITGFVMQ